MMNQPTVKITRLHNSEEQTAKGLRLNASLDMINPELSDDDLVLESMRLLSMNRKAWEARMAADKRTIAPEA